MKKRVLFAALDWGLGHLMRTISVMQAFEKQGVEIHFAGSKEQLAILNKEQLSLISYELPNSNINLNTGNFFNYLSIAQSVRQQIRNDRRFVKEIERQTPFDFIVSDHRYGFYSRLTESFFICHQIQLATPFLHDILQLVHTNLLKPFTEIWCPDFADSRIAGKLSKNPQHLAVRYLGNLSRFVNESVKLASESEIKVDILVLLSGPNPQKTKLLETIEPQLNEISKRFSIVVLTAGALEKKIQLNPSIQVHEHLNRKELNTLLTKAKLVISRTGYTTLLDLFAINKKAILIPTPKQYEQLYLGRHHAKTDDFKIIEESQLGDLTGKVSEVMVQQKKEEETRMASSSSVNYLDDALAAILR